MVGYIEAVVIGFSVAIVLRIVMQILSENNNDDAGFA